MDIDPARMAILLALEGDVFEALVEANRQDEYEIAERLFRIWVQLPTQRAWPIGPADGLVAVNYINLTPKN